MIRYSDSPRAEEEFYTTFEVKIDALENSVCWRSVLAPLPVRKRKIKKYAKRKANALVPMADMLNHSSVGVTNEIVSTRYQLDGL